MDRCALSSGGEATECAAAEIAESCVGLALGNNWAPSQSLRSEFFFDQSLQMRCYRTVIEPFYDFIEETSDYEALSNFRGNAARAQIEEFILIDLAGSCAVGATDVIGENFQARHRIGFGVITQQKIADFLIGVSEMGVRFYPDQATENGPSAIVERVFVKKIAGGMRRDVVLQRARVEFLLVFGNCHSEKIAATAFPDEAAQTFETRIPRPEVQIQTHG